MVVFPEQLIIGVHQFALTNGGAGLLGRHVGRSALQPQLSNANADGAGRDQHDFLAAVF
ncbi:hypothetical protein SDC9_185159 [bioreactor metagenome]|uniref:Uncharacterized protein n=1 Tax=bioreactor metagenome TaxID=1076179 RepID=A0A645HHG4_9ZZZZ